MSQRERMMVLVLGVLLLGGLGFAAYTLAAKPILEKQKNLRALTDQVSGMEDDLASVNLRNKRLDELYQRSLPGGDVDFAKQEYDSILIQLLQDADARGFTLDFDQGKSASTTGIPMLNPEVRQDKTTTYQRLVFKINIKRTNLSVVMDFLKRYYRLNLLHQITLLEIKRDTGVDLNKDERGVSERNDLTVNITTEGIILNGAPARKTLLAVPLLPNAAVLGVPGWFDMSETPSVGREVQPTEYERILALVNKQERNYLLIAAKDPFHGKLPEPKPAPPPPVKTEVVTPPKPDYSAFIKYSTLYRTTEGTESTADILIRDQINNEDYNLALTQSGERLKVVARKFYFIGPKPKLASREENVLEISNSNMRTAHKFKVYGLDGDALILGEKPSGLSAAAKAETPAPGGNGRTVRGGPAASSRTTLPPADPKAAVVGGMVVTAPQTEKIYRWEHSQKLSDIVELKGAEAEKAIQRAQSNLLDRAVSASPPPAPIAATSDGK